MPVTCLQVELIIVLSESQFTSARPPHPPVRKLAYPRAKDIYEGEVNKEVVPHGQGVCSYIGYGGWYRYEGQWKDGKKDGHGVLKDALGRTEHMWGAGKPTERKGAGWKQTAVGRTIKNGKMAGRKEQAKNEHDVGPYIKESGLTIKEMGSEREGHTGEE